MSLSLADRLVELNDAREKGLITTEEYKTLRTRILESFSQVSSTITTVTTAASITSNNNSSSQGRRSIPPPVPPPLPPPLPPPFSTSNVIIPVPMVQRIPPFEHASTSGQIFTPPNAAATTPNSPPPSPQPHSSAAVPTPSNIPQNGTRTLPDESFLQKRRNVRSFTISEVPSSSEQQRINIQEFEQQLPEMPPPPYTPPESRRRGSSSFFKPKTAAELRQELDKLKEYAKREQDSWKMEEARLSMRIGTKPEELERIRKKMRDSAEKYKKKIDVANSKLRQAIEQGF
ncbi:12419_t:CDS:2 [Ambispora leptoticha]|uniref:12419_t:CDS:1 n=1 Tax=Ambispora leptoticha TaxID=144679 RepID=A0A9N8VAA2_9GLOM|nr:12419_t:CDS:2 [Ambispora leptoticha]